MKNIRQGDNHVDDWIDLAYGQDEYPRWFFFLHRLSAALQFDWKEQIAQYQLYCTYEGQRWRCTGASTLGDILITSDFTEDTAYEKRVPHTECTDWADSPGISGVDPTAWFIFDASLGLFYDQESDQWRHNPIFCKGFVDDNAARSGTPRDCLDLQSILLVRGDSRIVVNAVTRPRVKCNPTPEQPKYLIGQRVILNDSEIGVVTHREGPQPFDVWVFSPRNGHASSYAFHNVRPLPGGQL